MQLYDNNYFFAAVLVTIWLIQYIWIRIGNRLSFNISNQLTDLLFSLCLACIVGTFYRLYPGNHMNPDWDSAVFLYIGKRMTEGKIPYVDLFDHKGPLLYLIQYLGCLLSPNSFTGVWFLEIINLFVALFISCKTVRLLAKRNSSIYITLLLTYFLCGWKVWQGGNFSEEYALPWISIALYIFVYFFKNNTYKSHHIILLGFSFAAVFLLRANMVAVWIAWIPAVALILLFQKRFHELRSCITLFIFGTILLFLPTVLIALKNRSLYAMWRYYILFNFSYTGQVRLNIASWLKSALSSVLLLWPGLMAIIVWLFTHPKDKFQWLNLLFFLVSQITIQMSGRSFVHYQIQMLPVFILPFLYCSERSADLFASKKCLRCGNNALILGTCFFMLLGAIVFRAYRDKTPVTNEPVIEYLSKQTEPDDDVLVLGNNAWIYLAADRKTENPFFYQSPPIEISDEVYQEFIQKLRQTPSDYIVMTFGETEVVYQGTRLSEVCLMLADLGYQYEDLGGFGVYSRVSIK